MNTGNLNFYINADNQCGLCKDLGRNKIHKLIKTTGSLEEIPDNTIFYDENLFLLTCDENAYFENEIYILYSQEEEEEEEDKDYKNEKILRIKAMKYKKRRKLFLLFSFFEYQ